MKLKHDTASEVLKFSRLVWMNRPVSSVLSENAMAWTRKSMEPQVSFSVAKARSSEASFITSQSTRMLDPSEAAKGATRLPKASP